VWYNHLYTGTIGWGETVPKLTIEVDEQAWQQLREQAERQGLTPEALAQQLLLGKLQMPERRARRQNSARKYPTELQLHEQLCTVAALPRGSLQRVFATLNLIHTAIPLDIPPPSREEVDAYLQQERASWEGSNGDWVR
jgi:hypothetical protein